MLVAAAVVEVIVGVDDVVDVAGLQSEKRQLPWNRLCLALLRLLEGQDPFHVLAVVAGVEDVAAVLVLDQDRIAGKPELAAGSAVPEGVKAVYDQRSAIE